MTANQQQPQQQKTGIQKVETAAQLAKLSPAQMLSQPFTEQRFIQLFNKVHGTEKGEMIWTRERFHFSKIINENPAIAECTTLSLFGCLLDTAIDGLSLDPSLKLTYLIPGTAKVVKTDPNTGEKSTVWEKRCVRNIAPQGELVLRQQAGQVKHADRVIIVYDGDTFIPEVDREGKKSVVYRAAVPSKSEKIIAAFIHLVRPDGSHDYYWMLERDWKRLQGYSGRKNAKTVDTYETRKDKDGKEIQVKIQVKVENPNALYSSQNGDIDPGMLAAKVLKHAFGSMPKIKPAGLFSKIEPENVIGVDKQIDLQNEYGFDTDTQSVDGASMEYGSHEDLTPAASVVVDPPKQPQLQVKQDPTPQPGKKSAQSNQAKVASASLNSGEPGSVNFDTPNGIF